jgi:hypothetical protein
MEELQKGAEVKNPSRDFAHAKSIEEDVAWFIGFNLGRAVINMPDEFSSFDYIFTKTVNGLHVATAVAEFRRRSTPMEKYPTFNINVAKVKAVRDWGEKLKLPPVLLVLWEDTGVMWCKLRREYPVKKNQERKVKDRANDHPEDQYKIPLDSFKLLMEYTVR